MLLFASAEEGLELWPALLTKAVIKLLLSHQQPAQVYDNSLVFYFLTGMVVKSLSFENYGNWQWMAQILSDDNYLKKDTHVFLRSCKSKKKAPANRIEKAADLAKLFDTSNKEGAIRRPTLVRAHSASQLTYSPEVEDESPGVQRGVCYPVIEAFSNEGFNMVYVQKRSLKEARLKAEYTDLTKQPLTSKTIDEKKEHRRRKKDLKEKLTAEEIKRNELIHKPALPYRIFKLLSLALNVHCEFSTEEIGIAKKCIANQLSKPPNYDASDPNHFSTGSYSVTNSRKDRDTEEAPKTLEDFSSILNYKEPLSRPCAGIWMLDRDLLALFDQLLIYFNPTNYPHKLTTTIEPSPESEFTYDPAKELILVQQGDPALEEIKLLFAFSPCLAKNQTLDPEPYCVLQRYDFSSFEPVSSYRTIRGELNANYITLPNKNQILRILAMTPLSYNLWVSCSSPVQFMGISAYLTEYEEYSSKTLAFDYGESEADKLSIFYRLRVKSAAASRVVVRLKMGEAVLAKYMRYRLIALGTPSLDCQHEGVIANPSEKVIIVLPYVNFETAPDQAYSLVLEAMFPFNVPAGAAEV